MGNSDLKILISGQLNVGKTIGDINVQLRGIEKRINALKLSVQIDDKILGTMNSFSEQMKRIQGDALQAGKRIEEVLMPDGTKVKTTSFDNLNKSLDELVVHANKAKDVSEQAAGATQKFGKDSEGAQKAIDNLTHSLDKNNKISKQVITENEKGQRTYQSTYKNLENATSETIKYNEATQKLTKSVKIDHEQEQKRITALQKVSQERAKIRRDLQGLQSSGQISDSQFNDLSKRLNTVKSTQDLNRYKETMSNLVVETNKASVSQAKLNQSQGQFRVNLQNLHAQGKITEQQLKQFSNAVDTTKSVGQVKRLSDEIDKLKIKANKGSNGTLNPFDTDMAMRKFDNRVSEAIRQYPSIDKQEISKMQAEMQKLAQTTGLTRQQIQHYNQALTETVTNTKRVTANTNTLVGAFQNAMLKFPIWMLASTAFFGTFRSLQSATRQVIELDTSLTTLNRTLSDGADINRVFTEGIQLANKLSVSIQDMTDSLITFSRQGFMEDEIAKLAEASTLASIVGNTTVDEAASNVTAIMNVYGVEIDRIVEDVIDKINEIDLNFAVTTPQIMDAMKRSASTAKTFGVELQNLASYATAIGVQTRESGNVIGNSLKSIFSRLMMDQSVKALEEVGVQVKNINGENKTADEVLSSLHDRWSDLTNTQQQNVAVTVAGRYQLSRFLALMNGYNIALDAQDKMTRSLGSSYKEAEKWNESLQARLNRMKNSLTEVSLAMGDAFVSDGIVTFAESISSLAENTKGVITTIGLLPPAIGLASIAMTVFNTRMRESIIEKAKASTATTGLTGAYNRLAASASLAGSATRTLSVVLRAIPQIAIFMGVAFALEKIVSSIVKTKKEQEEFNKVMATSTQSLKTNKDNVDSLIESYKKLDEAKQIDKLTVQQNEEYVKVQNDLAQLLPSLVVGEDAKGNSILISSQYLEQYVELLRERVKLESDQARNSASKNIKTTLDERGLIEGDIEVNARQMETAQRRLDGKLTKGQREYYIQEVIDLEKRRIELQQELLTNQSKISDEYKNLLNNVENLNQEDFNFFANTSDHSEAAIAEVQKFAKEVSKVREVTGDIFSIEEIKGFDEGQLGLFDAMSVALNNGYDDWEQWRGAINLVGLNADKVISHIINKMKEQADAQDKFNKGVEEGIFFLDEMGNIPLTHDTNLDEVEKLFVKINGEIVEYVEGMDLATGTVGDFNEEQKKLADQFNSAISSISTLNGFINELNENHQLSADSIGKMIEKYPELLGYMHDEVALIEQIKIKIKEEEEVAKNVIYNKLKDNEQFFNTLLKGNSHLFSELSKYYGVDLSNFKSLAHAKGEVEIKLINELSKKWSQYYNAANRSLTAQGRALNQGVMNGQHVGGEAYAMRGALAADVAKVNYEVRNLENAFKDLSFSSAGINFSGIGLKASPTGSGGSGGSGSKGSSSAYNQNTYVTDKYAQALDNLELRIKKLQQTQKNYPSTSSQYRKAVQDEIKLQQQKLKLTDDEIARLEKLASTSRKQGGTKNNQELDQLLSEINKLKSTRIDLAQTILDTRNQIADDLISVMKDAYREKQKIDQEAIRKEMDDLRKAHDAKIKLLDEEMKKYRELYDEKIREIDKQEDDDSYNKQLAEKQKELQKLESEKSLWMMDNSVYGRRMVAETEEQIANKQLELEEMIHKRSVDLRKQNLRDELEAKEKQHELQKQTEQTNHESLMEGLENEREALDRHYENILENEREWAKVREDILKGNIGKYSDMLSNFSKEISKNMELLGESVSKNLMDQLNSVRQFLNGISGDVTKVTGNLNSSTSSNNNTTPTNSSGGTTNNTATKSNLPLRKNSSPVPKNLNTSSSVTDYLKSKGYHSDFSDREALFIHLKGSGKYSGSSTQNDWLLKQLNIIGLRGGGFTGNNEGLAYLHDYEQVLNKNDTKNLFETIKLTDGLMSKLQSFVKRVDLSNLTNKTSTSSQVTVHMPVTIQSLNGTKEGANDFLNVINKGMKELGLKLDI